jgi:hypothetical protein
VLPAVELDDQPQFEAGEVREVRTDRVLATKAEPKQSPATQVPPETILGIGLVAAQLAGEISSVGCQAHARSIGGRAATVEGGK